MWLTDKATNYRSSNTQPIGRVETHSLTLVFPPLVQTYFSETTAASGSTGACSSANVLGASAIPKTENRIDPSSTNTTAISSYRYAFIVNGFIHPLRVHLRYCGLLKREVYFFSQVSSPMVRVYGLKSVCSFSPSSMSFACTV